MENIQILTTYYLSQFSMGNVDRGIEYPLSPRQPHVDYNLIPLTRAGERADAQTEQ